MKASRSQSQEQPSRCNWPVHHATPAWDAGRALFVEPAERALADAGVLAEVQLLPEGLDTPAADLSANPLEAAKA